MGGAVVYVVWGVLQDATIAAVPLILAAAVPPVAYLGFVYLRAYSRAAVEVYSNYRRLYDAQNPPPPWTGVTQILPDGRIVLRLRLSTRVTGADAESVGCSLHVGEAAIASTDTRGPVSATTESPIAAEFVYPDEFAGPQWPLEPGGYQVSWVIAEHNLVRKMGNELHIPSPPRRRP